MHADTYSAPGSPTAVNEDLALNGDHWAIVLDGAGRYPGVDIQCIHDVAWLVGRLGSHLSAGLDGGGGDLTDILAEAIRATAADHGPDCDTAHPLALGATVAVVRTLGSRVDWLVLGDAAVLIEDTDGNVEVVTDDRLERLPDPPVTDAPTRTYEPSYVARWRNQPGGFWVASAIPEAAYHSLTGSTPFSRVRRMLLCTDGITRLADRYEYAWSDLLHIADCRPGLRALVDTVRGAELVDPDPRRWRGKRHDDATATLLTLNRW